MNKKNITYSLIITLCILLLPSMTAALTWNPEDVLKTYLLKNYPWEEITVSSVKVMGRIPDERPETIIVEKGPLGKAVFSLLFRQSPKLMVKAHVRAFGRVVRSKRPLSRGHVLQDDDVYVAKMDIRKMPKSSFRNQESILGKSLKRSITANRPVVAGMIQNSQVVKRGQEVMLLVSTEGLNITAFGKTKEKGYIGQPVSVINLSSKKEVRGVLIDENTVQVEL